MAERIRAHGWAATPLGSIEHWPQSLKTALDVVLSCGHAMQLAWGPERIVLYNDGYAPMLGDRHPGALGLPLREAWPEGWETIEPLVERVFAGETLRLQDVPLTVTRHGAPEETWWSSSYSPVRDEAGAVAGLLAVTLDATPKVRANRAEVTLRESEARYHALFSASPVPFMVLAANPPDFTITAANDAYLAATLTTRDGLIGRRLFDVFTDDPDRAGERGLAALALSLDHVLASRRTDAMERVRYDIATPGGGFEAHWWLAINAPLFDAAGNVTAIIHQVDRQTELHHAEAALRASEVRFRALVSAGDHSIYRMSPDWRLMYQRDSNTLAVTAEPFEDWGDKYILAEDLPRGRAAVGAAIRAKSLFELEHRVMLADGGVGWVLSRAVPLLGHDGEITEWFGAGIDVTERRRVVESLGESERFSRALIEGMPQMVWRAVHDGQWTWASPQWTAFTGQSEPDSHGTGWLDPVHPDDRDGVRAIWAGAVERGEFHADYRIRHAPKQRYRWFQTRATPVRDDRGQIVEWLGTSTDVDDIRQLQERQGVLVAELQHRTRNLMAVVRSISEKTARASADLPDFRVRFLDRLEALSRVQGLLSRLNEHDRVTFDDLLRTELAAMNGSSERVVLNGPPGVRLRSSTVQTLALALHELATNAVKYGALRQPTARLAITWALDQSGEGDKPWLRIDWHESGVHMPPAGVAPRGTGQGRDLIERALPYQLKARTTYVIAGDGVRCTIALPVSERQEIPDAAHAS